MSEQGAAGVPQSHFDILKNSGILNPDVTLSNLIDAASQLSALNPGGPASVPTLLGDWYVYHQMPVAPQLAQEAE